MPLTPDGRKFSVYALTESGVIRYVGLTSQTLARRMNQHFQDINRPNRKEHKTNWLRACRRDVITVTIKSLRGGLTIDAAQRIEKQIIKRLRPQLVNVHEGGSSGYNGLTPEAKNRHSESGKARYRGMRQDKRERMLIRLSNMRAAKKRKHNEAVAAGWRPEPKFKRAYRFEIGIRNKDTGETCFVDLKSGRQAHKIGDLVLKYL